MADPQQLSEDLLAALRSINGVSDAYDGNVPEKLPETDGFVDPYIILWAGAGDGPGDQTSDGKESLDTLIWDFQTTAVGATAGICRQVDLDIRKVLVELRLGTGMVRRNPDGFNQNVPYADTTVAPSRFMLPRQWRLITN